MCYEYSIHFMWIANNRPTVLQIFNETARTRAHQQLFFIYLVSYMLTNFEFTSETIWLLPEDQHFLETKRRIKFTEIQTPRVPSIF